MLGSNSTIIELLRQKTSHLHSSLEDLPLSQKIVSSTLDIDFYVLYLTKMRDIMHGLEMQYLPLLKPFLPDAEQRKKSHLITNDLENMGFSEKPISSPTIPYISSNSDFETAFAMGVYYVIEGSTLGGRVILKNIHQTLGLESTSGASYFMGYGVETGKRWKLFLEKLDEFAKNTLQNDAIVQGSLYTFNLFYENLKTQNE